MQRNRLSFQFNQKELKFIQECIYQVAINQENLLSDFSKDNQMSDDETENFSVSLRSKIDLILSKMASA